MAGWYKMKKSIRKGKKGWRKMKPCPCERALDLARRGRRNDPALQTLHNKCSACKKDGRLGMAIFYGGHKAKPSITFDAKLGRKVVIVNSITALMEDYDRYIADRNAAFEAAN